MKIKLDFIRSNLDLNTFPGIACRLQPAVNRQPGFRRGGLVEQDVSP